MHAVWCMGDQLGAYLRCGNNRAFGWRIELGPSRACPGADENEPKQEADNKRVHGMDVNEAMLGRIRANKFYRGKQGRFSSKVRCAYVHRRPIHRRISHPPLGRFE